MGLRLLLLAGHRILTGFGVVWLISVPGLHPQVQRTTQQQFQDYLRQRELIDSTNNSTEWMTSHWDLGQNIRLDEQDKHLNATDTRLEDLRGRHDALAREVSEGNGESKVWFGIISAGLVAALGFAFSNFLKIRDERQRTS